MFTGIVQKSLPLAAQNEKNQLTELVFQFPESLTDALEIGASVAINGTCLTVTEIDDGRVSFDAMMETLAVTNLGRLAPGSVVNIERAARFGDEIGGHILSGHVHTQATLVAKETPENNCVLTFQCEPHWMKYVFAKGFIALNGASLTVGEVDRRSNQFNVYLIPETLRVTNFGQLEINDAVNLEVDAHTQAIVDTLERIEAEKSKS
mgnify:CR=1 FL=1